MSCSQTTIKQVQIFFLPPRLIKQLSLIVCIRVHKADHQTIHQHKNENLTWFWRNTGTMMRFFWRPFWGLVSCRLSSGVFTAGIASWDVPRVFIYELASSVTSSCLLSSAASGWCWRKREALNLYMNYTDPPSQYRKLHLRVCGRFGGAGYVWGCRGTDTFPGLVSETRQRQRHSAPRSIRCLLSTEEDNWGSVEARGANLYGSTSFCQVMGTLPVLNLA